MRIAESYVLTRRRILFLAAAVTQLRASSDDFWNTKPPSEWGPGEIYRLMNHSPWANWVEWSEPFEGPDQPIKCVVTWESALPIRQALKTPMAPVYANYYVIGMDGVPAGNHSADKLGRFATLRSSGTRGWKVAATSARERIRTSAVYQFAFPRATAPIGVETKEVVFEMNVGHWTLQSKFRPKEMLYRGELAL
jgi:hypothetical protein